MKSKEDIEVELLALKRLQPYTLSEASAYQDALRWVLDDA